MDLDEITKEFSTEAGERFKDRSDITLNEVVDFINYVMIYRVMKIDKQTHQK